MGYKFVIIFLALIKFSLASDFLLGLDYQKVIGAVKLKTTLFIFDDGTYLLHSSSGGIGLCLDDGKAGMFKGKLQEKDLNIIKGYLDRLDIECQKSKICIKNPNDKQIATFTLSDYRSKNKTYSFSEIDSTLLNYLMDKISSFKEIPVRSLSVKLASKSIELYYQGEDYQTAVGIDNFLVLLKNGVIVSLKDFTLNSNARTTIAKFGKNKKNHKFSPDIDWKKLKSEGNFLIYTNKVEAHHLDKNMKVYNPCVAIEELSI